jgi:hypothetical protein
MEVIQGPVTPSVAGIIYQVTLASGMIVTNPAGFGDTRPGSISTRTIVAEDGRVLVTPGAVGSSVAAAAVPDAPAA